MANRIAALRVLADILEEKEHDEKNGFDIGSFISSADFDFEGPSVVLEAGVSPSLCGTTLCVAGFAAIEAGYKIEVERRKDRKYWESKYVYKYYTPKGEQVLDIDWEDAGAKYLGLPDDHARIVFYGTSDDGDQSVAILERLAAGETITQGEWYNYAQNLDVDMENFSGYHNSNDREDEECACTCSACY